ncbi:Serine phosphatase RsbU, regulator of sigma subunit [Olavius algarvensis Delta 1 endosymbiont]|nr:Serine phosphatase RsbU, regulator of sigma subunit [Olavius algarvensis Delta 1 endosymbiont]
MTLGVIILVSFLVALTLRIPMERRYVRTAPEIAQPRRTFILELAFSLFAGVLGSVYNSIAHGFPVYSAVSLLVGCTVSGFFIGLDSALARERQVIRQAMSRDHTLAPPKRLFSTTRKFSFVALVTTLFISVVLIMVFTRDIVWLTGIGQDEASIIDAQLSVTYEIFFIMAVLTVLVVNLIISYSNNLKLLFNNETKILEMVTQGDLSRKVPVATSDEFGVIAGHTNNMIDGLRHRIQLVGALKLAEEVQQNLLPQGNPQFEGLDITGTSMYCDETGGDYYDYFHLPQDRCGIVVADASGHGVGAAMHMTTVRAFLHFGIKDYDSPAPLLSDVNKYVTRDSSRTGRFMSMFFLEIDPKNQILKWVRAGHDAALFYDRAGKTFAELNGNGMVLGVDEAYRYEEFSRQGWQAGDIILIGTDGIHETRNEDDQMFGQQRLQEIIQRHAAADAKDINSHIIDTVREFRGKAPQEDDVTLVVIKLL